MKVEISPNDLELSNELKENLRSMVQEVLSEITKDEVLRLNQKDYLSLGEACQYAGVSRGTLDKMIKEGLPVVKYGQIRRIKKQDLEGFLEQYKI